MLLLRTKGTTVKMGWHDMQVDIEIARQILERGIAFVQRSGLKVVELRRGYVKVLVPFSGNENHLGTMYAGALFTCAEIPGGALFLSSFDAERFFPVVKELNLRFLKPATQDVTVEISLPEASIVAIAAEAQARGKCDFVLEGELKGPDGVMVASSRGVYQIRARAET